MDDTRNLGFIGGPRFTMFTLCFKQILQFVQRFRTKSSLKNDQLTCPYRLTSSVHRIINTSFRNVLDTNVTNCFKVERDVLSVQYCTVKNNELSVYY